MVPQGEQECRLCRRVIRNAEDAGRSMYTLCNSEYPEYRDMCHAQQKVLQGCPEFSNSKSHLPPLTPCTLPPLSFYPFDLSDAF